MGPPRREQRALGTQAPRRGHVAMEAERAGAAASPARKDPPLGPVERALPCDTFR